MSHGVTKPRCAECGGRLAVIDCRARKADGLVRRRLRCTGCQLRFTTIELPITAYLSLLQDQKRLEAVRDAVNATHALVVDPYEPEIG